MPEYRSRTTVSASGDALFDYLADVGNLPGYFAMMREARRTGPEEVHTTAELPDGQVVEGDAWFRVDREARRIEWGSEDDASGYRGHLDVADADGGSQVEVLIHSPHDGGDDVQRGVDETVATIKEKVEASASG